MNNIDGITQSALLSRISNLRYEVTELDRKYAKKEIDKPEYEKRGYHLTVELEELEKYIGSLGRSEDVGE